MSGYAFEDLAEGVSVVVERVITPTVHEALFRIFHDTSPLHVDDTYARARGFAGRVMHGVILDGFVSEFIGTRLPGPGALLQKLEMTYLRPNYLGDTISLRGTVAQVSTAVRTIRIELVLTNTTKGYTCARAIAQVGVL